MEKRNYKVNRDKVFVGELVRTDRIYRYEGERNLFRTKPGQLDTGSWFSYRSMLFVPNEDKLADDLLYRSPNYPALNITDDDVCLNLGEKSIVVKDVCNLAELLEYFGYSKELTYEDIVKIRKTFFTGRFAMDHCELFGWKETKPEDYTYYSNGIQITDPKELKKAIERERRSQQAGHRSFTGISDTVLSRDYWDVLDHLGDKTLADSIIFHEKMDAFSPHKEEGKVKKLSRF